MSEENLAAANAAEETSTAVVEQTVVSVEEKQENTTPATVTQSPTTSPAVTNKEKTSTTPAAPPKRRICIVDAGAAIKLQRVENFGDDFYTTEEVLSEIKDKQARAHLQTLPFELKVRQPSKEDFLAVKDFAKKTGDLGFLSTNDMGLIALAVKIYREEGCLPELRKTPALFEKTSENFLNKNSAGLIGRSRAFNWAPQEDRSTYYYKNKTRNESEECGEGNGGADESPEAKKDIAQAQADEDDGFSVVKTTKKSAGSAKKGWKSWNASKPLAKSASSESAQDFWEQTVGVEKVEKKDEPVRPDYAGASSEEENVATKDEKNKPAKETDSPVAEKTESLKPEAVKPEGTASAAPLPDTPAAPAPAPVVDLSKLSWAERAKLSAAQAAGGPAKQTGHKKTVIDIAASGKNSESNPLSCITPLMEKQQAEKNLLKDNLLKESCKLPTLLEDKTADTAGGSSSCSTTTSQQQQAPTGPVKSRILGIADNTIIDMDEDSDWSDDDAGWVTSENISRLNNLVSKDEDMNPHEKNISKSANHFTSASIPEDAALLEHDEDHADEMEDNEEPENVENKSEIALLSTDYSVQNVVIQIGLKALSCDGFRIRSVKLWAKVCRACKWSDRDTTKMFCGKCGNPTLDRCPITLDAEGNMILHDNRRYAPNLRGTVYSIPKRLGGRKNGILIFGSFSLEYLFLN